MTSLTHPARAKLSDVLQQCAASVDRYDAELSRRVSSRVDEVALLVASERQYLTLSYVLRRQLGWEKFNEARDRVRTNPIKGWYDVRYHFFQHPGVSWRLEVMQIERGYSPLHGALAPPTDEEVCRPVHASFKVDGEGSYLVARHVLEEMQYIEAMRCDSTYGRFSYWARLSGPDLVVPYLKPRVNLRSQAV